jgi:hypothetical protein
LVIVASVKRSVSAHRPGILDSPGIGKIEVNAINVGMRNSLSMMCVFSHSQMGVYAISVENPLNLGALTGM